MDILKRLIALILRIYRKELPIKEQKAEKAITRPESPWLFLARKEIGTKEIPGPESSERVLEYHRHTYLMASDDDIAWCSSFVNFCFVKAGYIGTDKPNARSWMNWGSELPGPKVGCVVVLWRGSSNSWKGHVGLYLRQDEKNIYVLGGNQSNMVRVSKYKKSRVLGYRWPKESDRA